VTEWRLWPLFCSPGIRTQRSTTPERLRFQVWKYALSTAGFVIRGRGGQYGTGRKWMILDRGFLQRNTHAREVIRIVVNAQNHLVAIEHMERHIDNGKVLAGGAPWPRGEAFRDSDSEHFQTRLLEPSRSPAAIANRDQMSLGLALSNPV